MVVFLTTKWSMRKSKIRYKGLICLKCKKIKKKNLNKISAQTKRFMCPKSFLHLKCTFNVHTKINVYQCAR